MADIGLRVMNKILYADNYISHGLRLSAVFWDQNFVRPTFLKYSYTSIIRGFQP